MAIEDQVSNEVQELNGETVVFCAVCGDTDGGTREVTDEDGNVLYTFEVGPLGYAPVDMVGLLGWVRDGDRIVCGNPGCIAEVSGEDEEEIRALAVTNETMTEEQVANMRSSAGGGATDLDELDDASSMVQARRSSAGGDEEE